MPDLSGAVWRKSARSDNTNACVEVANLTSAIAVRDSKDPSGPALVFAPDQWAAFVAAAKAGEFDAR